MLIKYRWKSIPRQRKHRTQKSHHVIILTSYNKQLYIYLFVFVVPHYIDDMITVIIFGIHSIYQRKP